MLKTRDGFEIVPLRHEDKDGQTKDQTLSLLKKEGLDCMGVEEMMDCDDKTLKTLYEKCGRYRLITKHGLLVRSYIFFDFGRCVNAFVGPSVRYGVVGVRRKKHEHDFKLTCECGEKR